MKKQKDTVLAQNQAFIDELKTIFPGLNPTDSSKEQAARKARYEAEGILCAVCKKGSLWGWCIKPDGTRLCDSCGDAEYEKRAKARKTVVDKKLKK